MNDAEVPSIIYNIFSKLDFGKFTIRFNNRKILSGFFKELELEDKITDILRIVDKIEKVGKDAVNEMLEELGVSKEKANRIVEFISTKENVIEFLKGLEFKDETFLKGLEEIETVSKYMNDFGIPNEYYQIDLSIARGLDYYTGTVYETILDNYPEIGSVCSGGRYDNLAEFYTNKKLPGVGISIGLTRLFFILNEYNLMKQSNQKSISKAIIIPMVEDLAYPIKVATKLREKGINVEIYLEPKAIKKKMNYANKQNIPYAIIIGEDEVANETVTIKNMITGEQETKRIEEIEL